MSSYIQSAGRTLFRKHLEHYAPPDPVYEHYTDHKGKLRRKKRDVPPGISSRDAKILRSVQRRARCLDKSFNLCGLRFGWTFIIGIIPVAGDVACATLNYYLVVRKARQADLPPWLVGRMLLNNTVSACSGLVPVVGDVILAMYKANSRNAMLLEEFLRVRGDEYLKLQAEKEQELSGMSVTSSLSQNDMAQVKPGAGMKDNRRNLSSIVSEMSQRGTTTERNPDRGRFVENIND